MVPRQTVKPLADIRVIAAAIILVTLLWLSFDVLTDSSPSTTGGTFDRIDAYVRDQQEESRIPGVAIAIVEGDELVHSGAFGTDGRGRGITSTTPFWIGSNTKSFTALAVMQLVDEGLVELDAPVQRYLPTFRVADDDASREMTVRHLLNQTSGFSRASGIRPLLDQEDKTLEEGIADLGSVELATGVGEEFAYSNLNSVVLGLLVQEVSGQTWATYVSENVLQPLGMDNTYTSLETAEAAGLTGVHRYWFGFPVETDGRYLHWLAPSGFLYSSAEDMGRYLSMYLEGGSIDGQQVLSEDGVASMLTAATEAATRKLMSHSFDFRYGAGWFVGSFGAADDARWHLGNLPYFTAWMVLLPGTNQGVVVLINSGSQFEFAGANAVMSRIPVGIVNILRNEEPPEGVSVARFFIVFNGLVVLALAVQVWSLVRVIRGPAILGNTTLAWTRALGPLVWELGIALVILVAFPSLLQLNWRQAHEALPDLTLVLLGISGIWLATGVVRLMWIGRGWVSRASR